MSPQIWDFMVLCGFRSSPDHTFWVSGSPEAMPQEDSVGTEGQQVLPGAATETAVVGRVGSSFPAAVVMVRGLGQGLRAE